MDELKNKKNKKLTKKMEEKLEIQLNLKLTRKELNHFFWIIYGASFVSFKNAAGASVAYEQMVEQIEQFFINENPENKELLETVKKQIAEGQKYSQKQIDKIIIN